MYCKYCGKEIDNDSLFCKHCGKSLQGTQISTPYDQISENTKVQFRNVKWLVYIGWLIINTLFLFSEGTCSDGYRLLFPRLSTEYDCFELCNYLLSDYVVYAYLIPLTLFLGYEYFKKHNALKGKLLWGTWFVFHLIMYKLSRCLIVEYFFPFTLCRKDLGYEYNYHVVDFPLFCYDAYDLSELIFYTMLIPICYWGYLYYRDRKNQND